MGIIKDISGQRFGKLTVMGPDQSHIQSNGKKRMKWFCVCDCGNRGSYFREHLMSGATNSCGHCGYVKDLDTGIWMNKYDLDSHEYGIGYTSKEEEFYFDKEDFDLIKDTLWRLDSSGYVSSWKLGRMHRIIMQGMNEKNVIDHINHIKHDNRKANLRICTQRENARNKGPTKNSSTGILGVYWDSSRNKYAPQIVLDGHKIALGRYGNIEDAIDARREAELKYWGKEWVNNQQVIHYT